MSFTNVNYSGSFLLNDDGGGFFSIIDESASVTGTLTPTPTVAGGAVDFDLSPVSVNVNCNGTPGTLLTCGLIFGASDFQIPVNGNTRYFRHTVNVANIPEPGTTLLLGMGLSLLALRRQPARAAD